MNKNINEVVNGRKLVKAYDNQEFIHSSDGRILRIIAEYQHPQQYLRKNNVRKMIIVFGSARIISQEQYDNKVKNLNDILKKSIDNEKEKIIEMIKDTESVKPLIHYYDEATVLTKMIAQWSNNLPEKNRFHICTGGGPGIMEAANKGASLAMSPNVGFNISLPHEQNPNPFISKNLNFEFHYFFMRKFWFVYTSFAIIIFPGGFGTLDEMFEILTLTQTGKLSHIRPIILYDKEFWKQILNIDRLFELGLISKRDMELFKFANTPYEAFELLKSELAERHKIDL